MSQQNWGMLGQQSCDSLTHELHQYRNANGNLRRKIKQKDQKIQQLFGLIQEQGKQIIFEHEPLSHKPIHQRSTNTKVSLSHHHRKEKENRFSPSPNPEHSNIFKEGSHSFVERSRKRELKLPILERKNRSVFEEAEAGELRSQIVRIPLNRLKPLDSGEVKKRFLQKYERSRKDPQ